MVKGMGLTEVGDVLVTSTTGGQSASTTPAAANESGGLSSAAVAIIIVGVVLVLALIGFLYWYLHKKDKRKAIPSPRAVHSDAFFVTAISPSKSHDLETSYIDAFPNQGAPISATRSSKDIRTGARTANKRESVEPPLYNREPVTSRGINDSTRSYLHGLAASGESDSETVPKIFSSRNSVDLTYPDTDRSQACLDSVSEVNDSNRSHGILDSNPFAMDTGDSSILFGEHELASSRSSGLSGDYAPYDESSSRNTNTSTLYSTPDQQQRVQVHI